MSTKKKKADRALNTECVASWRKRQAELKRRYRTAEPMTDAEWVKAKVAIKNLLEDLRGSS